jgi:sugar lactone lactonase YvrE
MSFQKRSLFSICALTLVAACGGSTPPELAKAPEPAPAELPKAPVEATTTPPVKDSKPDLPQEKQKEQKQLTATPIVKYTEGIATPESVLYDEASDRYLVSNINGKPTAADDNGYIADLSPDGKVNKDKFIAGGVNKVKLDAPKGLGIAAGTLYVSDINVVRKFDAKTGAPKGNIPIPGATFLNDIAVAADGRVFVSDSGLKEGGQGFEPTGTDAVYVIDKGKVKTVAKSTELGSPNGLLAVDKGVLVVTFGSGELYRLDEKGVRQDITKLPDGALDGIAAVGDTLLISSWKASAVYRGKLGGKFEIALAGVKSPADIGFDTKRKRVLVPHFLENTVAAYDLKD